MLNDIDFDMMMRWMAQHWILTMIGFNSVVLVWVVKREMKP